MKPGFDKRRCPKCGGNLYFNRAYFINGSFISWCEEETCLQCGYIYSIKILSNPNAGVIADQTIPAIKQLLSV